MSSCFIDRIPTCMFRLYLWRMLNVLLLLSFLEFLFLTRLILINMLNLSLLFVFSGVICRRHYGGRVWVLNMLTLFQSLIISRLSHALSAWSGFLSKQQISKIGAFLSMAHRVGFTSSATAFNKLLDDADSTLFSRTIQNTSHCMSACTICYLLEEY